ncbi:hypothetical protein D3C76_1205560 [compost metagenome]
MPGHPWRRFASQHLDSLLQGQDASRRLEVADQMTVEMVEQPSAHLRRITTGFAAFGNAALELIGIECVARGVTVLSQLRCHFHICHQALPAGFSGACSSAMLWRKSSLLPWSTAFSGSLRRIERW